MEGQWHGPAPPEYHRCLSFPPIPRLPAITFQTLQHRPQHPFPPRRRRHPWPADPRRVVPHVLIVSAVELRDPVAFVIQMVAHDRLPDDDAPRVMNGVREIGGGRPGLIE